MSAFDLSPAMVALAREKLSEAVEVQVADLTQPLSYADGKFDVIACSLALHYVQDWGPTLTEMRRVLKPGGRLVVSIIHPFIYAYTYQDADYFALTQYSEDYDFDGKKFVMTYWHRPLQDVLGAFIDAGLTITAVTEPPVDPNTPTELKPDGRDRFISFLFFALQSG